MEKMDVKSLMKGAGSRSAKAKKPGSKGNSLMFLPSCKVLLQVRSRFSIINRECSVHFSFFLSLFFAGCLDTKEADIYFLIDGSGSIQRKQFEQIKAFMLSVVDMFSIGPNKIRIGVVQYASKNKEEFPISRYQNNIELKKAILNINQLRGGTLTGKALDFIGPIIKEGRNDRTSEVPCYLIVLTDGKSEDSVVQPAERLRAEQVIINAIGIGEANKTQLQQIAGEKERVNFGQNFDALKSIKNQVVRRICTDKGKQNKDKRLHFPHIISCFR